MMRLKNVKKLIAYSIGPIVAGGLGILVTPLLTYTYTPEVIALIGLAMTLVNLTSILVSMGGQQYYVREYHEVRYKIALLKDVLHNLCIPIFCLAVGLIMAPLEIWVPVDAFVRILIWLLVLFTVGSGLNSCVARMKGSGFELSAIQIAPKLTLLIFVALVGTIESDRSFKELLILYCVSNFIGLIVGAAFNIQALKKTFSCKETVVGQMQLVRFGIPIAAANVLYWIMTSLDRFLMLRLSSLEELGNFTVATSLASVTVLMSSVFNSLWHPLAYGWVANGNGVENIEKYASYVLVVIAVIWSVMGYFGMYLPEILSKEYKEVAFIFVPLMSTALMYILAEVAGMGALIIRKPSYLVVNTAAAIIVNITLNFILIPKFGAIGAGISAMWTFAIYYFVRVYVSGILWCRLKINRVNISLGLYLVATTCIVIFKPIMLESLFVWIALLAFVSLFNKKTFKNCHVVK